MIEPLLKGRRLSKPLIAAVEGPAIAGGTEILQACDIRVAGASARFGVSEARWGLFPLGGSAVRLPRQIPYTVAADLLLTGRHISAAEALSIGLIGHVVPDGQALARALEIAEAIAANGPVAVRAILRVIRETEGMAENEAFALEAKVGMAVFASEDAKEGPRAFAEKRRPSSAIPRVPRAPECPVRPTLIAARPLLTADSCGRTADVTSSRFSLSSSSARCRSSRMPFLPGSWRPGASVRSVRDPDRSGARQCGRPPRSSTTRRRWRVPPRRDPAAIPAARPGPAR